MPQGKIKKMQIGADYYFPATVSEAVYVDPNTSLKDLLDDWKQKRGSGFGTYVIDVVRWGLDPAPSDFGDAVVARATSIGINNALLWASSQGYAEVVLPRGTYLIHEDLPVVPQSNMTLNLDGSTLRIRNNGYLNYAIISYTNYQQFSRVTNGKLQGDRYTHDYTPPGSHESGEGVNMVGCKFISIDNLEIFETTGDGVGVASAMTSLSTTNYPTTTNWEQGDIDLGTGSFVTSTKKVRCTNKFPTTDPLITRFKSIAFFGNGASIIGTTFTTNTYNIYFYDASNNFISSISDVSWFDFIDVPTNSNYFYIVVNQSVIPDPANNNLSVRVKDISTNIFIEKCEIHDTRRTGLAVTGRHVYIRDNWIHNVNGTLPQLGIDIEDAFEANQYFYIENNKFENLVRSFELSRGKNIHIKGNNFFKTGIFQIWGGSNRVFVFGNSFVGGSVVLNGETIFSNNQLYNSNITIGDDPGMTIMDPYQDIIVSDCLMHNTWIKILKAKAYSFQLDNCHFFMEAEYLLTANTGGHVYVLTTSPHTISNCVFEGSTPDRIFTTNAGTHDWIIQGCKFINTIHPSGWSWQLPEGYISDCIFDNVGNLVINRSIVENCVFKNIDTYWGAITAGAHAANETLRIKDCKFIGNNTRALKFDTFGGILELINNGFEYNNATSDFNIVEFSATFSCNYLLIDSNRVRSNRSTLVAFKFNLPTSNTVYFKNNLLNSVTQTFNDTVNKLNNYINGTLDPYNYMSSTPTSGKYNLAQIVYNSTPTPNGELGWVCTTAGYANNSTWTASTTYVSGAQINSGGHVYQAVIPSNSSGGGKSAKTVPVFPTGSGTTVNDVNGIPTWSNSATYAVGNLVIPNTLGNFFYECTAITTGTPGATEPTWPTIAGITVTDGGVTWTTRAMITWKEIGSLAVFKQFGAILNT